MPDDPQLDLEFSESGQPIYHYKEPLGFEPASMASDSLEAITEHIEKYIGPVDVVFHELVSDKVHIDVHVVKPSDERPFYTLITSGMSDLPMSAPQGAEDCQFAELVISLPADWKMTQEDWQDEKWYWPIRWLKIMARFPHDYQTWLWWGHTVPNGNPPEPFVPGCPFSSLVLFQPITTPEEFWELEAAPGKTISFFGLYPVFQEELDLKLKKGAETLLQGWARTQVTEVLDLKRKNTAAKRGFWPF